MQTATVCPNGWESMDDGHHGYVILAGDLVPVFGASEFWILAPQITGWTLTLETLQRVIRSCGTFPTLSKALDAYDLETW